MIYFCADDYGMSRQSNPRIESCLKNGALNKVSVLPNGETEDFKNILSHEDSVLSLHINLVEGKPLSDPKDIGLLVTEEGFFKYSFTGILALSLSPKRKELERQIYTEIKSQIRFWKSHMGDAGAFVDSHQHTHMIPLVFGALLRAVRDEGLRVDYLRIPAEPVLPYILTPSLYFSYSPVGLVKQWLLKLLFLASRGEFKRSRIKTAYFMGVLFSGQMTEDKIKRVLPHYLRLAQKKGCDIELCFHPGYSEAGEVLMEGSREDFGKFYFSPWRRTEYDTLMNIGL